MVVLPRRVCLIHRKNGWRGINELSLCNRPKPLTTRRLKHLTAADQKNFVMLELAAVVNRDKGVSGPLVSAGLRSAIPSYCKKYTTPYQALIDPSKAGP